MNIRHANISDRQRIIDIYNQAVDERFCTADTEPVSIASRADWFAQHKPDSYPLFVAALDDLVIGWCSLSPYRPGRKALCRTVEISYYLDRRFRGRGLAGILVEHVIEAARQMGFEHLVAILMDRNQASVRLLEKTGFARWGHLPGIADFGGVTCGQYLYGRKI